MRLIDADALRKDVEKDSDASDMPKMWYQGVEYAINHIIHAPTVDSVKHGMWINISISANEYEPSSAQCNLCGARVYNNFSSVISYCPKCGAKMKEVEE